MRLKALNNTASHWPSVDVDAWTPDSADFPWRIALGGHTYHLAKRTPVQPFDGGAFWARLVGIVQTGQFPAWLCFAWRPRGRFDCVDPQEQSAEPVHALLAQGGALYVRVDR